MPRRPHLTTVPESAADDEVDEEALSLSIDCSARASAFSISDAARCMAAAIGAQVCTKEEDKIEQKNNEK